MAGRQNALLSSSKLITFFKSNLIEIVLILCNSVVSELKQKTSSMSQSMSSDEQHQQMSSSSSVRTSVTSSSASYSTATAEGQNVSDRRDPFFHSLSYYIRWLTRRFFISWINLFNPAEMSCLVSELTSLIIKWASE
jgi:hypothetical protein